MSCHFTKKIKQKKKPRQFSLIHLLFPHCANGSLLFVYLLVRKQMEVIHCTWTKQTCPSMLAPQNKQR